MICTYTDLNKRLNAVVLLSKKLYMYDFAPAD